MSKVAIALSLVFSSAPKICRIPERSYKDYRRRFRWLVFFSDLIAFIKLDPPALQQVMAGFAAQMLGLLYAGQQVALSGGEQASSIVQQAIARMRSDMTSNLEVKVLAEELNVGYSSFRHTFQQHTGSSPHRYLLELRLARARNLLEETSLNIKEIAQHAGFEDEHYFCRFFKQKTGCTPGQWRSKLKSKRSSKSRQNEL